MIFTETKLKDAYIIELEKLGDERGFFARSWCQKEMESHGLNTKLRQANISLSKDRRTLRGLHLQKAPFREAKLIRCTKGALHDVIVDLRKDSPSFMQWIGVELTSENYKMLYVPEGFAHGFLTLENNTEASYQVSQFYTPEAEVGIRWNDPSLEIKWPFAPKVMSEKDKGHPDFNPDVINW